MRHNLLRHIDVRRAANATAAGTSAINGTVIDMLGYESIAFVAALGTLTATQVTGIKVQQSDASDGSGMNDLAGSASGNMADADSNKLLAVEIYRPTKRYVRCVVTRGTANAVLDGIIALLYRAEITPAALHSTVAIAPKVLNSPAQGTA